MFCTDDDYNEDCDNADTDLECPFNEDYDNRPLEKIN